MTNRTRSPIAPALLAMALMYACGCETKSSPSSDAGSDAARLQADAASVLQPRDAGPPPDAGTAFYSTMTPPERAAYEAYGKAISQGRELMKKKDYAGAIKAFDAALASEPSDARAMSDRGYARFLQKDYAGAARDLDAAQAHAAYAELEAQIWFNLGQAEEAMKHDEASRYAYTMVQNTRPSTAAAKRLIGLKQCDARVDDAPVPAKTYASWLAAWRAFEASPRVKFADGAKPKVTSNDEAKAALCKDSCSGDAPWVVRVGDPSTAADIAVIAPIDPAGVMVLPELGQATGGRCGTSDVVTVDHASPVHVHVVSKPLAPVVLNVKGEDQECDLSFGDECRVGCVLATWSERDYLVDMTTRKQTVRIEQDGRVQPIDGNYRKRVQVVRKPEALYLRGGGCDRDFRFDKK